MLPNSNWTLCTYILDIRNKKDKFCKPLYNILIFFINLLWFKINIPFNGKLFSIYQEIVIY